MINRFTIGLLSIIAATSLWWLVWNQFESSAKPTEEKIDDTTPEFIINQFQSRQFNKLGTLESTINAEELINYAKSDVSTLKQLVIEYMEGENEKNWRWHITADEGKFREKKKTIQLFNNVIVKRIPLQPGSENILRLSTERLLFDFNNKEFKSASRVTISTNFAHINSKGIVGNMDSGIINFPAKVEATYFAAKSDK